MTFGIALEVKDKDRVGAVTKIRAKGKKGVMLSNSLCSTSSASGGRE